MIAADTSTWIAFLSGMQGGDVDALRTALTQKQAHVPPPVLTELLSDPRLPSTTAVAIRSLPLLDVTDGFWERAGILRSKVIRAGRKAALADCLIAQSCLDHDVILITRDAGFRNFRSVSLKLYPASAQ